MCSSASGSRQERQSTIPSLRELVLVLDRTQTTHAKVQSALDELMGEIAEVTTLRSRKFVLPCWYDDPWSAELAARYGVDNNLDIIAEANATTVVDDGWRATMTATGHLRAERVRARPDAGIGTAAAPRDAEAFMGTARSGSGLVP